MLQSDIGDNSPDANAIVPVQIPQGATVTVTNVAGSPLNYFTNIDAGPAGTISVSGSQSFTSPPVWIQSQGRTSIQVTGGNF